MSKDEQTVVDPQAEQIKKLTSLIFALEDKGLVARNASVGRIRADYYKASDLETCFVDNMDFISDEINKILKVNVKKEKKEDTLDAIYHVFHSHGIFAKAIKIDGDKAKYPKRLFSAEHNLGNTEMPAKDVKIESFERFENNKNIFYLVNIERGSGKLYFYLAVVVIGVLCYCLFPVWPFEVKMAVWWVSYILLIVLLAINVVRYTLFLSLYIFGLDFWIFPNLYDDKAGILDSFKPFYTYSKREETWMTILVRLSIAIAFLYASVTIYINPEMIDDIYNHVFEAGTDFFDWGKNHVINYHVSLRFLF
jgi:translocation protein SEC62